MFKTGLSSCSKPMSRDLFENYQKAGIDAMEITLTREWTEVIDYRILAQYSKEYNVELWSMHVPFYPFDIIDISSMNSELRKSTVNYVSELVKRVSEYGVNKFVIHPSDEPIAESDRAEKIKCAQESLAVLAQVAGECGSVIAVENLPRTCLGRDSDDILKLIEPDERLRVCFDTNHLLKQDIVDFVHKVGDKIITTHVSDYDFVDEKHWLPGEGQIDWQALVKALKDINYQGAWLYELGFTAPKSMPRSRDLTCENFARNAKEIFNNETLTIVK